MRFYSGRKPEKFLTVALAIVVSASQAIAQDRTSLGDIYREKFKASAGATTQVASLNNIISAELVLNGGSKLSLVYPSRWQPLADHLKKSLTDTHASLTRAFGEIPKYSSSVRLMDEDTFYLSTGAPSWTNALYYKGQILIPISEKSEFDKDNLERSLKHELMHAVVNALSSGKCPGWLDEGLAEWVEGTENPALQPALDRYLKKNPPVPLKMLQSGFTKLDTKMVPAAYAQSLYATHTLINTYGLKRIGIYLKELREGSTKAEAFIDSFSMSEDQFEARLGESLREWARKKS